MPDQDDDAPEARKHPYAGYGRPLEVSDRSSPDPGHVPLAEPESDPPPVEDGLDERYWAERRARLADPEEWHDPPRRGIDWRSSAPFVLLLVLCVGVGLWLGWPSSGEGQVLPAGVSTTSATPTPTSTRAVLFTPLATPSDLPRATRSAKPSPTAKPSRRPTPKPTARPTARPTPKPTRTLAPSPRPTKSAARKKPSPTPSRTRTEDEGPQTPPPPPAEECESWSECHNDPPPIG